MAWRRIVKEVRPNTGVAFYEASDSAKAHIQTTYEDTGKSTSFSVTYSGDNLTKTKTRVFNSESSRNEFMADSVIQTIASESNTHSSTYNTTKTKVEDAEI